MNPTDFLETERLSESTEVSYLIEAVPTAGFLRTVSGLFSERFSGLAVVKNKADPTGILRIAPEGVALVMRRILSEAAQKSAVTVEFIKDGGELLAVFTYDGAVLLTDKVKREILHIAYLSGCSAGFTPFGSMEKFTLGMPNEDGGAKVIYAEAIDDLAKRFAAVFFG